MTLADMFRPADVCIISHLHDPKIERGSTYGFRLAVNLGFAAGPPWVDLLSWVWGTRLFWWTDPPVLPF
jgi:hypothetical protein